MPGLSADDVKGLAELARIQLSDTETRNLTQEFGAIFAAIEKITEVASDDVPATSHPLPLVNVTRPDTPRPSLTAVDALSGAPEAEDDRFRVPRILDEE